MCVCVHAACFVFLRVAEKEGWAITQGRRRHRVWFTWCLSSCSVVLVLFVWFQLFSL